MDTSTYARLSLSHEDKRERVHRAIWQIPDEAAKPINYNKPQGYFPRLLFVAGSMSTDSSICDILGIPATEPLEKKPAIAFGWCPLKIGSICGLDRRGWMDASPGMPGYASKAWLQNRAHNDTDSVLCIRGFVMPFTVEQLCEGNHPRATNWSCFEVLVGGLNGVRKEVLGFEISIAVAKSLTGRKRSGDVKEGRRVSRSKREDGKEGCEGGEVRWRSRRKKGRRDI